MGKMKKNPSKASVSAASAQGNAGPGREDPGFNKTNSQNSQFKK
ncbi:YuzL family protein [Neobacillus pocheonensis]